jgi:PadR family transcriptional regulator, regulatory protein PadR
VAVPSARTSRFELAPPRRFILPAILLLLTERPGYGYGLLPRLEQFRFGHVDRPAVYRALAQLEQDGLVEASSQHPTAGQARRVYRVTAMGERVLRVWMGVVKDEQDFLGQVLRRYQATERADALLAEVDGGWGAALAVAWSPVAPTGAGAPHLFAMDEEPVGLDPVVPSGASAEPASFRLIPARSVVLIEVRSTAGPLRFGTIGLTGFVEGATRGGELPADVAVSGHLEVNMSGLSSGNGVYDAELRRRIDVRRFPTATVDLCGCSDGGVPGLFHLDGELTFHGVTRPVDGTVKVEALSGTRMLVTGDQAFDIRDFAIPSPTALMLRIYPDVRVRLQAEAELEEPS